MSLPVKIEVPKITPEQYDALENSIKENGLLEPVTISSGPYCEGGIIDGYQRKRACSRLKIDWESSARRVPIQDESEFALARIDMNLARRHLTTAQRIALGYIRMPYMQAKVQEMPVHERKALDKQGKSRPKQVAIKTIAESVGVSTNAFHRGQMVLERAPEELKAQFIKGELSPEAAYEKLRRIESKERQLPAIGDITVGHDDFRPFKVLMVDSQNLRGIPLTQLIEEDALVWVWARNHRIVDTCEWAKNWGLRPLTVLTWAFPDPVNQSKLLNEVTEQCLVFTAGNPPKQHHTATSLLQAARPDVGPPRPAEFYEIVERSADGPIGVIGEEVGRDGWVTWTREKVAIPA